MDHSVPDKTGKVHEQFLIKAFTFIQSVDG